jgi:uncharacterized protein (TIGR02246 family)
MADELEIRRIIDEHAAAVGRGDASAMLSHIADDVLVFDVVAPLRRMGGESVRQRATEWLSSYDGPVLWENRDVVVAVDGGVAFCTMLSRVAGTLKNGNRVDMWFRKTLGLQRRDGQWLITHDHGSVPFDPATGKASLTLQP